MNADWAGRFREIFLDPDHAFSMGRMIAFIGVCLSVELINLGVFLILEYFFASLAKPDQAISTGLALIGIGSGFFTGGALLKFGQKAQENASATAMADTSDTRGAP